MQTFLQRTLLTTFIFLSITIFGQNLSDLSKVNVDDLSDAQIEAFLAKAKDSGLSQQQLELLATQRGMSQIQISKLRDRINQIQRGETKSVITSADRLRSEPETDVELTLFEELATRPQKEEPANIFGKSIFKNVSLGFEPSQNIATPLNYVLGPGDEIIIDVYGASEITYRKVISPDGKILISGVGPISLVGISVEDAKKRIFNQLSNIYSGMKGSTPNTFLEISLGSVRTIKVSVVGNVEQPGTYAISSFSTAFNALYAAGGPSNLGSMRNIEVVRKGVRIATLDVYNYFYEGDIENNPRLQDEDVLVIKSFQNQVEVIGELNNVGIFEFKRGETMADLIDYAGGFKATAYRNSVTVDRVMGINKTILVVDSTDFESVELHPGDKITITSIIDKYVNRVKIEGAVYKPGFYQLEDSMTLEDLVNKAEGLRQDFYRGRGNIIRQNEDLSLSNIAFNVTDILSGSSGILLENEDIIRIPSISDLTTEETVSLRGEVNNPGDFAYVAGMTVEDLVTIAGGLKVSASTSKVEVARRIDKNSTKSNTADIYEFQISESLTFDEQTSDFELEPFDLVTVKASSHFRKQKTIKIEGEVIYPGFYALETESDRITDLIERAGGLTPQAYVEGASLIRLLDESANTLKTSELETTSTNEGDYYRKLQLQNLVKRDSVDQLSNEKIIKEGIGIQLQKALSSPDSKHNLILQHGDVISIPNQLQTVRVRGEVLYPTRVKYDKTDRFKDYISLAGGFSDNAHASKSYIVYANGRATRTKKFLFFRDFPPVQPGADILVPEKPERKKLSAQEIVGITSSLATLVFIIDRLVN